MEKKKVIFLILGILLLAGLGVGAYFLVKNMNSETESGSGSSCSDGLIYCNGFSYCGNSGLKSKAFQMGGTVGSAFSDRKDGEALDYDSVFSNMRSFINFVDCYNSLNQSDTTNYTYTDFTYTSLNGISSTSFGSTFSQNKENLLTQGVGVIWLDVWNDVKNYTGTGDNTNDIYADLLNQIWTAVMTRGNFCLAGNVFFNDSQCRLN